MGTRAGKRGNTKSNRLLQGGTAFTAKDAENGRTRKARSEGRTPSHRRAVEIPRSADADRDGGPSGLATQR
jgi:hypothetical protein